MGNPSSSHFVKIVAGERFESGESSDGMKKYHRDRSAHREHKVLGRSREGKSTDGVNAKAGPSRTGHKREGRDKKRTEFLKLVQSKRC